ncbi:MAG: YdcF family protein [Flavobacteriales bacterium]|nr:MAG: YdcF family protein [Flavobacteriales bacterium]
MERRLLMAKGMHRAASRRFAILVALTALLVAGWLGRTTLLRATGHFLVREDALVPADAIYVLGGSPEDRSMEAMRLQREGWAPRIICTGETVNELLLLHGIARSEAALGRDVARREGFPMDRIELVERGTSTFEEALAVLGHAHGRGYDTVMVVTTDFHTRRVGQVFRKRLEPAGITVVVRAARSTRYDAERWWASEDGLIMVNNEIMKLGWYALHH